MSNWNEWIQKLRLVWSVSSPPGTGAIIEGSLEKTNIIPGSQKRSLLFPKVVEELDFISVHFTIWLNKMSLENRTNKNISPFTEMWNRSQVELAARPLEPQGPGGNVREEKSGSMCRVADCLRRCTHTHTPNHWLHLEPKLWCYHSNCAAARSYEL